MLPPELEALLEDDDRLGVPSQQVQRCRSVVVEMDCDLKLLGLILDLEQDALAHFEALLGSVVLQVQEGEVLSGRKVVGRVFERRLEQLNGSLAVRLQGLTEE